MRTGAATVRVRLTHGMLLMAWMLVPGFALLALLKPELSYLGVELRDGNLQLR